MPSSNYEYIHARVEALVKVLFPDVWGSDEVDQDIVDLFVDNVALNVISDPAIKPDTPIEKAVRYALQMVVMEALEDWLNEPIEPEVKSRDGKRKAH